MEYLIDGHNLIAAMPDIALDDPDDEARLVARLRAWTMADRRRRVLVIFDGGLVAGKDPRLSSGRIEVYFAPAGQTADSLLVRRIGRVHNPTEVTLITSDRAIIAAASERRLGHMFSEAFAARLEEDMRPKPAAPPDADGPVLSPEEVQEWLDLFGPVPERPPRPPSRPARRPSSRPAPAAPPPPPASPDDLKAGRAELTPQEMAEWLDLFGPDPAGPDPAGPDPARSGADKSSPRPSEQRRRRRPATPSAEGEDAGRLSREDREAWLAWLGDDDPPEPS